MTTQPDHTSAELPSAVVSFIDAINTADTDAFVAAFSDDGYVNDWGTQYEGHVGVRRWAGSDAIGADAHMTVLTSSVDGDTVTTRFNWQSRKFTGESTGIFTIASGRVTSFTIPPEH